MSSLWSRARDFASWLGRNALALALALGALALAAYLLTQPKRRQVQAKVRKDVKARPERWPDLLNPPSPSPAVVVDNPTTVLPQPIPSQPETAGGPGQPPGPSVLQAVPHPDDLRNASYTPLSPGDMVDMADRLMIEEATAWTVTKIEAPSGKGFDPEGRPVILVEYHKFSKYTGGRFDASHPHISNPKWKAIPYPSGRTKAGRDKRWAHLAEMWTLDPEAAFKAASWGLFQVMGDNFGVCGYANVFDFVRAMASGELPHLKAFEAYCASRNLVRWLRQKDWFKFAIYNGTGQQQKYADMLAAEYETRTRRLARREIAVGAPAAPVRQLPKHGARCMLVTDPNRSPPARCTCGLEGATLEVVGT